MRRLARAITLSVLLALTAGIADAHDHAPTEWFKDAGLVLDAFPRALLMSDPIEPCESDGTCWIYYYTAIGLGVSQGRARAFEYTCNTIDGARELYTFGPLDLPRFCGLGGVEGRDCWTTQERHGVYHFITRRLPCR